MPPVLRVFGAASSLAVMIDGKDHPFGVLDVHATEPHRFSAKDVPFVQAAANVLADAIERHAADQALRHRVLHDSLTGLPNRLSFVDALDEALKRATVSGSPIGILFLDLDHFKLINDSLGHHAGDALLRGGGAAPARPPAARRRRRPLRRRRVRDPDRPPRRRRGGDRDRRPRRRRLRPALLDRRGRALRHRQHRRRRRPPRRPARRQRRAADPRRRRGDVPGQGRRPRPLRAVRRGDAGQRDAPARDRTRAAPRARARGAGPPLPAGGQPRAPARSPASRRWSAGSTPSAACSTRPSSSRSPRTAA